MMFNRKKPHDLKICKTEEGGRRTARRTMNKVMAIRSTASHKLGVCRHILLCNDICLFKARNRITMGILIISYRLELIKIESVIYDDFESLKLIYFRKKLSKI